MKRTAAALTMVKDDHFFLQKWVSYYGGMFGREALHVVSHGPDAGVDRIAAGCSIIRIPGDFGDDFDARRWQLLNSLINGLLAYYSFVICTDVDEFVVLDPKLKMSLPEFLSRRRNVVITPVGVEVVHLPDQETEPVEKGILATRRHCRYSSFYSKPCIIGKPVELSRGGHYAKEPTLRTFRNLYLFHMKYCDLDLYRETARKRAGAVAALAVDDPRQSRISNGWFAEPEGFGPEIQRLAFAPRAKAFDLSQELREMHESWAPRNRHGLWHFRRKVGTRLYPIPKRFAGLL